MSKSGQTFMEMREKELAEMPLLELMTEADYVQSQYGSMEIYREMLNNGHKPTLEDLDNLFGCSDEECVD